MKKGPAKPDNTINEATLEARIDGILKQIFPAFKKVEVIHQKSFTLKLGHHDLLVDQKEPSRYGTRAISDILLKVEGKNVILLELKKEGHELTEQDINQGVSYARLIDPMPPITVISNGTDHLLYDTFVKKKLETDILDINKLNKILNSAFTLAKNDLKEALSVLLNSDHSLFSKVINDISRTKFEELTGRVTDYNSPICSDFSISRVIVEQIDTEFITNPLVGIVSSAYSGKTNVMYQFFQKHKNDHYILYVDCYDYNASILQDLANAFSAKIGLIINADRIREWIINSLSTNESNNFYLLIDNFNKDISDYVMKDILELINIFIDHNQFCLYTLDEHNFDQITRIPHRNYRTTIGKKSKVLKLKELNFKEYETSLEILFNIHRINIQHGGHKTQEYREPRILRHLASYYNHTEKSKYLQVNAVPDLHHLTLFGENKVFSDSTHTLYKKLSSAFLNDSKKRITSSKLLTVASGSGAVSLKTFNDKYNKDLSELIKSSTTVMRNFSNGLKVIYPKIPELIAYHSIKPITNKILSLYKKGKSISYICKEFQNMVVYLPYCDIVGTGVLKSIGTVENINLFSSLVQELMKYPPKKESIGKGTEVLTYVDDFGHIKLKFDDDFDHTDMAMISNFLPFAILSQLAGFVLGLLEDEPREYSKYAFHLTLLYELGSNKNFLRRADARSLSSDFYYQSYDWEGVGHLVCGREGIVEPLVQSIFSCFFRIPEEIEQLYERAFEEDNFVLLWRIYLGLREIKNHLNGCLVEKAKAFTDRFEAYSKVFISKQINEVRNHPDFKTLIEDTLPRNILES
tara:strand:- start:1346 stop:3766 length:2421 start_codon:yes stop_codon:yes gene_type:complete